MANHFLDSFIKLALILLLSILPSLVYLLIFRRAKERWQLRLRRAQILSVYHNTEQSDYNLYQYDNSSYPVGEYPFDQLRDSRRIPVTKYFIGDTTCVNNANSPYIRCAINPSGPCEGCVHYQEHLK
ncbi:hypothetical protein NIES4102_05940 [Chondrocystis sp. NIES-4102]|nr:hypothetical protein NIES4102_05940 [Chondrocystis sp. NIES-4102]